MWNDVYRKVEKILQFPLRVEDAETRVMPEADKWLDLCLCALRQEGDAVEHLFHLSGHSYWHSAADIPATSKQRSLR